MAAPQPPTTQFVWRWRAGAMAFLTFDVILIAPLLADGALAFPSLHATLSTVGLVLMVLGLTDLWRAAGSPRYTREQMRAIKASLPPASRATVERMVRDRGPESPETSALRPRAAAEAWSHQ